MMAAALFHEEIAAEPYEHRGIPHSEMALIIETCRDLGVQAVIESGRARGQSTYMLAKYLPHVHVHSIEMRGGDDQAFGIARVQNMPNVTLYWGDGREGLPTLARQLSDKRVAVLCDGPKGAAAVDVVKACFDCDNVVVGFIHDMRRLDHGGPSPHRAAALAAFPNAMFSDEAEDLSHLDRNVAAAGGPVGPEHFKEFGSYGPTVAVLINPNGDHSK